MMQLTPADVPLLKALLELFGEAFDDKDTYTSSIPTDDYLERLLGREHFVVLVTIEAGAVIGGLVAYELEKFEQARSEIYIYDLAVAEAHRRKGVATALIEYLRSVAAERGAYVVIVQADQGDDPAINLYSKLGVRESVLHFDIEVNPARAESRSGKSLSRKKRL